jgi:hypothetical protein
MQDHAKKICAIGLAFATVIPMTKAKVVTAELRWTLSGISSKTSSRSEASRQNG